MSGSSGTALVNINTADLSQLDSLPGIGPALAQRIIDYRETNGPFGAVEDIKNVSGIGDKKFDALKDLITVY
jgi:competence protein ComEA